MNPENDILQPMLITTPQSIQFGSLSYLKVEKKPLPEIFDFDDPGMQKKIRVISEISIRKNGSALTDPEKPIAAFAPHPDFPDTHALAFFRNTANQSHRKALEIFIDKRFQRNPFSELPILSKTDMDEISDFVNADEPELLRFPHVLHALLGESSEEDSF